MTRRYKILSVIAVLSVLMMSCLALALTHDSACRAPPPLAANAPAMKAMVYRCYGSPEVVKLETLEKPRPAPGRMLIKVAAASVNPLDWHYLKGEPYLMRAVVGMGSPNDIRLGVDFAGTVEAVGENVTQFKPGDAVFGGADGSFGEYVTVRAAGSVAPKPASLTFEQAAAVPIAGVTALQALRDYGKVRPGQRVLINGASGGVGTFAVQIAKILGANVTGVCSARNAAMVRAIGADRVIDYTHEDFTRLPERYDLIIDNVGNHSQSEYRRVLTPSGAVVAVGGVNCGACLGPLLTWLGDAVVSPLHRQKRISMLAELNQDDLETLGAWLGARKMTSVIDRAYALSAVPAALGYLEQGHARGKVVIRVQASGAGASPAPELVLSAARPE
ncbi:MAG TPA: NAD(P)-dependent alcohol dehydrogenase [Steroidobacteraceae bacterium]